MEAMRELMMGPRDPETPIMTFWLPEGTTPDPSLCSICGLLDIPAIISQPGSYEFAHLGLYTDIACKAPTCPFCALIIAAVIEGWRPIVDWSTCTLDGVEVGLDNTLRIQIFPMPPEAAEAKIATGLVEQARIDILDEDAIALGLEGEGWWRPRVVDTEVIEPEKLKEWVGICDEFHGDECGAERAANVEKIPECLRVIDLKKMRLVPVKESGWWWSGKTSRYVTLSYVWGKAATIDLYKTTAENFEARTQKNGLRGVKFPRTILDAMEAVRRLGERYLWVDAVCIIQNSDEDRALQIGAMNIVYGAAYLTLVAAGGEDSESPIPRSHPESRHKLNQQIVPVSGVRTTRPLLCLRDLETDPNFTPKWFTRGWTYQERQLSTRLLVFTAQQVFFQCRKSDFREGQRCEQHTATPITNGAGRLGNKLRQSTDPKYFLMPRYAKFVEDYTERDLTLDSDALNAFMGVGAVLSEVYGERYRLNFGLPGPFFEEALTWQPAKVVPMVRRPEFPSWSWAGWRGAVKYISPASTDWMLITRSAKTIDHIVGEFQIYPGPERLPVPPKGEDIYARLRGAEGKPFARLPPLPSDAAISGNSKDPNLKLLKEGTVEFVTAVVPGTALKLLEGDEHGDNCTCFRYGAKKPLQADLITRIVDADGVTCGSMGIQAQLEASSNREFAFICISRSRASSAEVSCPGFDTRKYTNARDPCFDVMLVQYPDDGNGVAERVAVGRIHDDAWVAAQGLRWERVWLR